MFVWEKCAFILLMGDRGSSYEQARKKEKANQGSSYCLQLVSSVLQGGFLSLHDLKLTGLTSEMAPRLPHVIEGAKEENARESERARERENACVLVRLQIGRFRAQHCSDIARPEAHCVDFETCDMVSACEEKRSWRRRLSEEKRRGRGGD